MTVLVRLSWRNHDNPHLTFVRKCDAKGEKAAVLQNVLLGSSQSSPQNLPQFTLLDGPGGTGVVDGLLAGKPIDGETRFDIAPSSH